MNWNEINLINFPAEECTIPLLINNNFYKSPKQRLVLIYNKRDSELLLKNLYPCLGEKNGKDIFGFVSDSDLEFYSFENEFFNLLGFTEENVYLEEMIDLIKSIDSK